MKILLNITSILFFFSLAFSLPEDKFQIEKSIQTSVESIISKITGDNNFVVLVNVDFKTPQPSTPANFNMTNYPGVYMREEEYLPGVTYSFLPSGGAANQLQNNINKITINVGVDFDLNDVFVEKIKSEIQGLLGLNLERGDTVSLKKIQFKKEPVYMTFIKNSLPSLYVPLIILILSFFLFGPVTKFFGILMRAVQSKTEMDTKLKLSVEKGAGGALASQVVDGMLSGGDMRAAGGAAYGGGMGFGSPTIELALGGKKEKEMIRKHFEFISQSNLKKLWHLVKDEPPSTIALVMNYLPQDLASDFMYMLDRKSQAKVALELASVKMPDPQEVNEIEQSIKARIDYCIGGEEYFLSLLDQADRDVQEEILKSLSFQNPELVDQLREKIFLFEDLSYLDKTTLQKIVREAQRRGVPIAMSLKCAPEEVKTNIMDCLTAGGRAMLAEQMDLLGELGDKIIKNEQRKMVVIVRDLINTGEVTVDRSKFAKEKTEPPGSIVVEPEELS